MGEISSREKYKIINELISNDNNELNISLLCEYALVSRSGFYAWKNRNDNLTEKELKDRKDFELILEAYKYRGYDKGSRGIQMRLQHSGIIMNRKKIQRLMRKYNLVCSIRKPNPYKQMIKALEESSIAPNILDRKFREYGPRIVLLTDITYLFYGKHLKCYLSTIKDAYTREILAWVLSKHMLEDFVLETINQLITNHKDELKTDALIHSDQGIHYKAILFRDLLKDNNLRQSMSRKANCWDNAPKESFFGHMKDEINLDNCASFEDVLEVINNYIDYYNKERPQWTLAKLTPTEYYQYSITDIYPLKKS